MSGKFSRNKGADAEREVAILIEALLGVKVQRQLSQYQDGTYDLVVKGGQHGAAVSILSMLGIEVKRHKQATEYLKIDWWRQTITQCKDHRIRGEVQVAMWPCLWYRTDRQPWQVVVPLKWIDDSLSNTLEWEYTATISPQAFAMLVREKANE